MGMPSEGVIAKRPYPDWSTDTDREWIEALVDAAHEQGKRIAELERRLEDLSEVVWRPILEGE